MVSFLLSYNLIITLKQTAVSDVCFPISNFFFNFKFYKSSLEENINVTHKNVKSNLRLTTT